MAKKLFVKTYGCQMNVYDSGRMADALAPHGYALTDRADDADLILLNTCHIREKAAEKVYSELGRLQQLRRRRRAAGRRSDRSASPVASPRPRARRCSSARPTSTSWSGRRAYHRLPELLHRRARSQGAELDTDFPLESKFDRLPEERAAPPGVSAFLTVQEGCDKFCTFCVVPYTRGAEVSRPAAAILAEARAAGRPPARARSRCSARTSTPIGAPARTVRPCDLARLIRALAEIEGLARIRYTTSHPLDLDAPLIEAHREVEQADAVLASAGAVRLRSRAGRR